MIAEPAPTPVPPAAAPEEATDARAAVGAAVFRPWEEDKKSFPRLRNQMLILLFVEEIEQIGVEDRLVVPFFFELKARDGLATELALTSPKNNLRPSDVEIIASPFDLLNAATGAMADYLPPLRAERIGIEIDVARMQAVFADWLQTDERLDFRRATNDR